MKDASSRNRQAIAAYDQWMDSVDFDPNLQELLARYTVVGDAIVQARQKGHHVPDIWLMEVGLMSVGPMGRTRLAL